MSQQPTTITIQVEQLELLAATAMRLSLMANSLLHAAGVDIAPPPQQPAAELATVVELDAFRRRSA
jgi:hypothetical protein